jgi:hypothetical protein
MAGIQLIQAGGAGTINSAGVQDPSPSVTVITELACQLAVVGTVPTTYTWSLSVPHGSFAELNTTVGSAPIFTPDLPGAYSIILIDQAGAVYNLQLIVQKTAITYVTGPFGPAYVPPTAVARPLAGETIFCDSTNAGRLTSKNAAGQVTPLRGTASTLSQASWFIDPVAGNDSNDGTSSTSALKTDARRQQLWGVKTRLSQATTVTYLSSLPTTDPVNIDVVLVAGGSLSLTGVPVVSRSGTLSAVTALNRGSQQPLTVTDGVISWAADVGKQFFISAGARANSCAWVAKDLGGGQSRLSNLVVPPSVPGLWFNFGIPTVQTPQAGDAYQIRTIPNLTLGVISLEDGSGAVLGSTLITITNLWFSGSIGLEGLFTSQSACLLINNCILDNCCLIGSTNGSIYTNNCRLVNALASAGLSMNAGLGNGVSLIGGVHYFDYDVLMQNSGLYVTGGASLWVGTVGVFDTTSNNFGCKIDRRSTVYSRNYLSGANNIWGLNNAGFGMFIESGSACIYASKPTINGGLGVNREASVGGLSKQWTTEVPFVNTTNNAMVVLAA